MNWIDELASDSLRSRVSSPGIPKTYLTPSASRHSTKTSDALRGGTSSLLAFFRVAPTCPDRNASRRHNGRPRDRARGRALLDPGTRIRAWNRALAGRGARLRGSRLRLPAHPGAL